MIELLMDMVCVLKAFLEKLEPTNFDFKLPFSLEF